MATKKKVPTKTRQLKQPVYKSFRMSKRIKSNKPKLPSARSMAKETLGLVKKHWRFFVMLTLLYGLLSYVFIVSASNSANITDLQQSVSETIGSDNLTSDVSLFGLLVGGTTQVSSQTTVMYQVILLLVLSLALIQALRQMYGPDGTAPKVKETLYTGMTPLIPLLLVLLVVGVQLLPLSVGSSVYSNVLSAGLAVTALEKAFWVLFVALLLVLTAYMLSSSLFAMYIVTLPGMTPVRALKSARALVRYRRWEVMRKLLFLPLVLLISLGVIVIPLISFIPSIAEGVFFVCSMAVLPLSLSYVYVIYRKLL